MKLKINFSEKHSTENISILHFKIKIHNQHIIKYLQIKTIL